jgi:TolA-binding protein
MAIRIRMPEPVRLRIRRGAARPLGGLVALLALTLVAALAWYAFGREPGAHAEDRDSFIAELKDQVRQIDAQLERLQKRASTLSGQARQELEDQQGSLEKMRARAEALLKEAQQRADQSWQDAEPNLRESWRQLQEGLHKLLGTSG